MSIKIEFITSEFIASRGGVPRGRGSWAFSLTRNGDDIWLSPSCTYTEARKLAHAHYAGLLTDTFSSVVEVWVQP